MPASKNWSFFKTE